MMKKITLLFALVLAAVSVNAQIATYYSEDFTNQTVDTEPTGFVVHNEDTCTVNAASAFPNNSWLVKASGDAAYGNIMAAQSWTNPPGCQSDDWLVTPAIDLTSVTGTVELSFDIRSFEAAFPEDYEVLLSTTGTAVADFSTTLLSVNGASADWTTQNIDISTHIGNTIYVAFRLTSDDKSQIRLDNIRVGDPIPYNVAVSSIKLNESVAQTTSLASAFSDYLVVDFSKRTALTAEVEIKNIGQSPVDTIRTSLFLLNGAGNAGEVVRDTIALSTALAPDSTYTHTFAVQDLTAILPSLATNDYVNFIVQTDSFSQNLVSNTKDAESYLVIAPTVSYPIPFSSSFEAASGGSLNFDHSVWGWKYLDNDGDGNTLAPHSFSNITMHDGSWGVIGSIVNGTSLSLGADDETLQSPEFTLNAGSTYEFSIYARTWPGQSGSVSMVLTNAAGTNTFIGNVTTAPGDTANFAKHSFQIAAPSAGTDFMVNINKSASGFIILDQFEIVELQAPTAPTVTNTWNACDSTATVNFNIVAGNTYNVDWGDGTTETGVTPPVSHQYSAVGTSYNVAVTASNIIGSANGTTSVTAEAPAAPTAVFTYTANGSNVNFTVTNPNPCSTYEWSFGDNTPNASGTSTQHNYTAAGSYTVTLTETNALGAMPSTQTIVITTSINEIDFVNGINVFPNPANDNVNIAFELNSAQNVEIALVSLDGKVVKTLANSNVTKVNEKLNVANLAKGIYILDITTAEGKFTTNLVVR